MAVCGPCCPSGGRSTWTKPPMEGQGQGTGYTPGPHTMRTADGSGPSWTTAGKTGGLLPPVRRAVDPVHGRGREVQRMDPEPRPVCRSEAIRGKWGPDRPFAAPPPGRYNAEPGRSGHGQPYQR